MSVAMPWRTLWVPVMGMPERSQAAGPPDDGAHVARGDASMRSDHVGEEAAAAAVRPSDFEVGDDGLTDVDRQGQLVAPASLAGDDDLAGAPVDVGELEGGHLAAPQTEPDKDGQDGEVAPADAGRPIAAGQNQFGLAEREGPGQRASPPAGQPRHRLGQWRLDVALEVEETEERAQRDDDLIDRPGAVVLAHRPQVRSHIGRRQGEQRLEFPAAGTAKERRVRCM